MPRRPLPYQSYQLVRLVCESVLRVRPKAGTVTHLSEKTGEPQVFLGMDMHAVQKCADSAIYLSTSAITTSRQGWKGNQSILPEMVMGFSEDIRTTI